MRARTLLVLLLPSAVLTESLARPNDRPELQRRDASGSAEDAMQAPQPRAAVGAPIDGVDGKPHAGPFVETGKSGSKESSGSDNSWDSASPQQSSEQYVSNSAGGGVMDDPNRPGPKEGTRGTEGGISEKSKSGQDNVERKPDSPKDPPPLPHSEQQKIPTGGSSRSGTEKAKEKNGDSGKKDDVLQKPGNLPEAPHTVSGSTVADIDDPSPAGDSKTPSTEDLIASHTETTVSNEIIQPLHSFLLALSMIIFSEVGDKTFLVAALMAMRHPRMVVFSSAFTALITMTVLSAVLGHAVPSLIPASYTNLLAGILFLVFGGKMLLEARAMAPDETASEEMKEVEMELEEKEHQQQRVGNRRASVNLYALESGRARGRSFRKDRPSNNRLPSPETDSSSSSRESSPSRGLSVSKMLTGMTNLCSLLLSPAWVQTFVMTFLGEWGDRSQIATIAMAAGQDYWYITGGAIMGHGLCTAAAVLGGRAIAGKVSMRVVTFGGAIAFLIFGLLYLFEAVY